MKVGDLVKPLRAGSSSYQKEGHGVILDCFEDDHGLMHYEVQWLGHGHLEWWTRYELEVTSESR